MKSWAFQLGLKEEHKISSKMGLGPFTSQMCVLPFEPISVHHEWAPLIVFLGHRRSRLLL